jgi:hypothetical protein
MSFAFQHCASRTTHPSVIKAVFLEQRSTMTYCAEEARAQPVCDGGVERPTVKSEFDAVRFSHLAWAALTSKRID